MQQLLTGKIRFPGFMGGWRDRTLSELVEPISRSEEIDPCKKYRLLGVKWYVAGAHIHETLPGSQIAIKTLSKIYENDIVYNKMWVTKKAFGIARKEHHGAYGSTEYPQFIAVENKFDVNFLGYLFFNSRFQFDAYRFCQGTTGRARLHPKDFLKIEVFIPHLEEQQRISESLETCDQEIRLLSKKLSNLIAQKQGLMQKLLTGEVRVKA
jgi:type I restriction enzyme S subunit